MKKAKSKDKKEKKNNKKKLTIEEKKQLRHTRAVKVRELAVDNIVWLFGCCCYSAAINIFNVPNNIAQGGFSGLAIVINYLTDLPVGLMNLLLNVPLFVLALIFLGKKFVGRTLWATVMLSVVIDVMAVFLEPYAYTGDKLLAALFGGALSGFGLALVFWRGATTGGTDIMARLIRLKFRHISMGKMILISDALIILIAAIVFRSVESALYAAIVTFVSSRVLDYVLYGFDKGKLLMIVSEHAQEIAKDITTQTKRGVSILPVIGGYTGQSKNMLVCVLRGNEVSRIMKIVKSRDPNTFTIITEAGEIIGKGFKYVE